MVYIIRRIFALGRCLCLKNVNMYILGLEIIPISSVVYEYLLCTKETMKTFLDKEDAFLLCCSHSHSLFLFP